MIPQYLSPEMIHETLTRVNNGASQITFGYVHIDRPESGFTMYFAIMPPQEECPHDGYLWLDAETPTFTTFGNDQTQAILYAYERNQGVIPGQNYVSMTRKRYQLISRGQPMQVQMLHYIVADASVQRKQVNVPMYRNIRRPPRLAPVSHIAPIANQNMYTATGLRPRCVPKKRPHAPPEEYGIADDDNNTASTRDVAVIRMRRNLEWMECILQPHKSRQNDEIEWPSIEILQSNIARLEREISNLDQKKQMEIDPITAAIKSLDSVKTEKDFDNHIHNMGSNLKVN